MKLSRRKFTLLGIGSLILPGFLFFGAKRLIVRNGWVLRDGD